MTETESPKKQCRICLDDEHPDDIISPCFCSGNSAYVHRECLDKWRAINKNGRGFKTCDICSFEYVIETINDRPDDEKQRLTKYYISIARDLCILILFIQCIIIGIAYFLMKVNEKKYGYRINFLTCYLYGVVCFFVFIGIMSIIFRIYQACVSPHPINTSNSTSTRTTTRHWRSRTRSNSSDGGALLIIFVGILFTVGVCVAVNILFGFAKYLIETHKDKLWLQQEAKKYVVKDFQEQRNELNKYKAN